MKFIKTIFVIILFVVTIATGVLLYIIVSQLPEQKYIVEERFKQSMMTLLQQKLASLEQAIDLLWDKAKSADKEHNYQSKDKIYFKVQNSVLQFPQKKAFVGWQYSNTKAFDPIRSFYKLATEKEFSEQNYPQAISHYKTCLLITEDVSWQVQLHLAISHCFFKDTKLSEATKHAEMAMKLAEKTHVNPYLQILSHYQHLKILHFQRAKNYHEELLLFYRKIITRTFSFSRFEQQKYWQKMAEKLLVNESLSTENKKEFDALSLRFKRKLQLYDVHDLLNANTILQKKAIFFLDKWTVIQEVHKTEIRGIVVLPEDVFSYIKSHLQIESSLVAITLNKERFIGTIDKEMYSLSSSHWPGITLWLKSKQKISEVIAQQKKSLLITLFSLGSIIFIGLFIAYIFFEKEQQLSQIKSEFVACISHELRTPLALIQSYAETLHMRDLDKKKTRKYCSVILKETLRLTKLIQNILNLSKIEKGQFFLEKKPQRIDKIIKEVISQREKYWAHFDGKIELEALNSLPKCDVDSSAMSCVIFNLLDNAIKYDSTHIHIKGKFEQNFLYIEISDNGIGIEKNEQRKIFRKFYRSCKDQKGVGLGLALVRKILVAHGGGIEVSSKPGKGSTFTIFIVQNDALGRQL